MAKPSTRYEWLKVHYEFQDGKCKWCKRKMGLKPFGEMAPLAPLTATIDHVKPRSKGGKDSFENSVAACCECNGKKGDVYRNEKGNIGAIAPIVRKEYPGRHTTQYRRGYVAAMQGCHRSTCWLAPSTGQPYRDWQDGYTAAIRKTKENEQ